METNVFLGEKILNSMVTRSFWSFQPCMGADQCYGSRHYTIICYLITDPPYKGCDAPVQAQFTQESLRKCSKAPQKSSELKYFAFAFSLKRIFNLL